MGVIFGWLPAEFVPCTDGHVTVVTRQLGCALFAGAFVAMLSLIRSRKMQRPGSTRREGNCRNAQSRLERWTHESASNNVPALLGCRFGHESARSRGGVNSKGRHQDR